MQMCVIDEKRIICIPPQSSKIVSEYTINDSEAKSNSYLSLLEPFFKSAKQKKYTVAVFESGKEDLKESIIGLLLNQKKRNALTSINRENRGT